MGLLLLQGLPATGGLLGLSLMANSFPKARAIIKSLQTPKLSLQETSHSLSLNMVQGINGICHLFETELPTATHFIMIYLPPELNRQAQKGLNAPCLF